MKCYYCGDTPESGKDFIPIDKPGTVNRRWACTCCANEIEKKNALNTLDATSLEITRLFSKDFLKGVNCENNK